MLYSVVLFSIASFSIFGKYIDFLVFGKGLGDSIGFVGLG